VKQETNFQINTEPKKANILIVDDEPANIKLLERMLTAAEYSNVISTDNSVQVVPLFKQHDLDLIILDLDMPVMDGFAVLDKLGEIKSENFPPVLVLSAIHMQEYRQRALDKGARDYVTKPFDMNELLARVYNLLQVELAHKYISYQNEILESKVRERTRVIHNSRLQIVRHLGLAAEYRDNETGLHIIRMSKIAVAIGLAAGMNDEQCDLLLNATPMHDIGKIGIPDHILLKPGKLNKEEWTIMQTHAQIGADILADDDSELMHMAHEIAISHHEKWNGGGYPNKLKGINIPLSGRISAIADVFDALTSKRPYKVAWPTEEAVKYINNSSGEHFDPNLVSIFNSVIPQIIDIKEKYAEPVEKTELNIESYSNCENRR